MIVFNRKYIVKRCLKKRYFKASKLPNLRFGTAGIYCLYPFRFEYRYFLFFRKFFKRILKRRKRKIRTPDRRRTWLFIRPNCTLTHKSKNARMGKGKGNFKRWCTIVHPGRVFIEHLNPSLSGYKRYLIKMQKKMKLNFRVITRHKFLVKNVTLTTNLVRSANKIQIIRIRSNLLKKATA